MLNFLHGLITVMDPSDFVNTMDTRLAVSRIINWTMEPRNVDVRKVSRLCVWFRGGGGVVSVNIKDT